MYRSLQFVDEDATGRYTSHHTATREGDAVTILPPLSMMASKAVFVTAAALAEVHRVLKSDDGHGESSVVHPDGSSSSGHGAASEHVKPATVFGIISDLQVTTATSVFLIFIVFIVVLEFLVKKLEEWAHKRGLLSLVEKMQKELMVMGIISFVIFMFENFSDDKLIEDHTSSRCAR